MPTLAFSGPCGAGSRQVRVTGGAAGTSPESAKEVDNTSGAQFYLICKQEKWRLSPGIANRVIQPSESGWSHLECFLENHSEIIGIMESAGKCDFRNCKAGIAKKIGCRIEPDGGQVFQGRLFHSNLKSPEQRID